MTGRRALSLARPLSPAPATRPSADELAWRNALLTMEEAAAYLRYTGNRPGHSAYNFLHRHRVKLRKRGNFVLVRRGDIDDLLETGASDFVTRALEARG